MTCQDFQALAFSPRTVASWTNSEVVAAVKHMDGCVQCKALCDKLANLYVQSMDKETIQRDVEEAVGTATRIIGSLKNDEELG